MIQIQSRGCQIQFHQNQSFQQDFDGHAYVCGYLMDAHAFIAFKMHFLLRYLSTMKGKS